MSKPKKYDINKLLKFFFVFLVIGLADSVYLSFSHFRTYTDIAYSSFCAISKAMNCDTVSQSPYSILYGLPMPIWGVIGYCLLFLLFCASLENKSKLQGWFIICCTTLFYCLCSIILGLISSYIIKSYCIMCILSYVVNFVLMFISIRIVRNGDFNSCFGIFKSDCEFFARNRLFYCGGLSLVLISVLMIVYMPKYWKLTVSDNRNIGVDIGLTDKRNPWIGSMGHQTILIEEYSDYMCFQCQKMHFFLRKLVQQYPDKIRLVHRNYPMDHEYNPIVIPENFHVGSGKLSLIAIYSADKKEFWQISDRLFEIGREKGVLKIEDISKRIGLPSKEISIALNNKAYSELLRLDIRSGMKNNIIATPSYIINGKVYIGNIPIEVFKEAGIEW